jgi:hypothetical protein
MSDQTRTNKLNILDNNTYTNSDMLSASMIMDETNNKVPTSKVYKWVDDHLVTNCFSCSALFTLLSRKHHCRSCCRIFCSRCANYYIVIPEDFSLSYSSITSNPSWNLNPFSKSTSNSDLKSAEESDNVRVCHTCYRNIGKNVEIFKIMSVFTLIDMDITILKKMRRVSNTWREYADFLLNKFRELQYVLPNHKFTKLEKKLLWDNYFYSVHHPKYLVQLLKSLDHDSYTDRQSKLQKIIDLLTKESAYSFNAKLSCKEMMCTRYCILSDYNKSNKAVGLRLNCADSVSLLDGDIKDKKIREYATMSYYHVSVDELLCYLPFLVYSMRHESIENSVIGIFLVNKCTSQKELESNKYASDTKLNRKEQIELCNEVYWELTLQIEDTNTKGTNDASKSKIYKYFLDKLEREMPPDIGLIIRNNTKFVKTLSGLFNEDLVNVKKKIGDNGNKQIILPINSHKEYSLDYSSIAIKKSISMPIYLPFYEDVKQNIKYDTIFKFESIRNDQIILNLIKLTGRILQKENIDLPIITYKIRPTSLNGGFIELVPDSETIYNIKEVKHFTVYNYISEHNPNATVDQIRKRFLKSCAVYCVLTYIFGIGDRHLDNIMVTRDGTLFHIDYSYMFSDPKLSRPSMRIGSDLVDCLGGLHSVYFAEFKQLCTKIYNAVRRHVNLFIIMLSMLTATSKNITTEKIYSEIINRFAPGESIHQADIQLSYVIANSSDYVSNIIDMVHHHAKKTVPIHTTGQTFINSVWGLFSSNK